MKLRKLAAHVFFMALIVPCLAIAEKEPKATGSKPAVPAPRKQIKKSVQRKKQTAEPTGYRDYYVRKRDTLYRIARIHGVTVKAIQQANDDLNPKRIRPGSLILIPVYTSSSALEGKKQKNKETIQCVYRVQQDDTLLSISQRFGMPMDELRSLNKLKSDILVAGMPIVIRTSGENNINNCSTEHVYSISADNEDPDDTAENSVCEQSEVLDQPIQNVKHVITDDEYKKLLNYALDFLGTKYKYGGSTVAAIDCSAFVQRVYKEVNISLPRTSREQFLLGSEVPLEYLKEGDLLFFKKKRRIDHVAIYIGNEMYIHAARRGKGVMISQISYEYFKKKFAGAKRLFRVVPADKNSTASLTDKKF